MMLIKTPLGMKRVRDTQLSENGQFIKVHDILGNRRWCLIQHLKEGANGGIVGRFGTTDVLLKPTTFLPGGE